MTAIDGFHLDAALKRNAPDIAETLRKSDALEFFAAIEGIILDALDSLRDLVGFIVPARKMEQEHRNHGIGIEEELAVA